MVFPENGSEFSLHDYLSVLRRRAVPLVLTIVLAVAGAFAASSLQKPVYAATAELLLQGRSSENLFDPETGQRNSAQHTQTEIKVLQSDAVRELVRERLGFPATVSVTGSSATNIVRIRAESTSPRVAAQIANTYGEVYIEFKRTQGIDDLLAAADQIQGKINQLQTQIDAATDQALKNILVQQQAVFTGQMDKLQLASALNTGGAQLLTKASAPTEPVRPKPFQNAAVALVLGTVIGLGLAFLIEYLDDSLKTTADVERSTGLSAVGVIPKVQNWKSRQNARVVTITDPDSAPAEAYRTLRTSVQFLSVERTIRSLQVTSANPQEGKTTTISNLGVTLARAGQRVVVICCDLRRPRLHEFFGLDDDVGFTSVLLGEVGLASALQRVPGVERLYVLAAGPLPPNPSELLSSSRAAAILDALKADGNFVLIDSPPVLPVTDALILSKHVDATLLVAEAGGTSRRELSRAVGMMNRVKAPVVGAVLNGVSAERGYAGYGYQYYGVYSSNGNGKASNGSKKQRKRAKSKA